MLELISSASVVKCAVTCVHALTIHSAEKMLLFISSGEWNELCARFSMMMKFSSEMKQRFAHTAARDQGLGNLWQKSQMKYFGEERFFFQISINAHYTKHSAG